ncbi:MAG: hypothetical protein HY825_01910 [Acidobacteria bacterium]|nr:hypothetical protein [Acidobacteriota bacterium]
MAKPKKTTLTKSDFILEQGEMPAKDIVAKGKTIGLELTEKYVYTIRSVARSRKLRDEHRAAAKTGPNAGASSGAGALPLAVAAEVGLGRAIELLQTERRRVVAMLKG